MTRIGIDLGTTSVKLVAVISDREILFESKLNHDANISGSAIGVQDATKIVNVAVDCLLQAQAALNTPIKSIAIDGQMHGIVFWDGHKLTQGILDCSPLFTWMYTNSTEALKQAKSIDHKAYDGYGNVTLIEKLYDLRHGEYANFDRCGTIADLVACYLTGSELVVMSRQMANSWRLVKDGRWDNQLVEMIQKAVKLPEISSEINRTIGNVVLKEFKDNDIKVLLPLGDLQASVCSVAYNLPLTTAQIIIGTSAQLCVLVNKDHDILRSSSIPSTIVISEYCNDKLLLSACAMNGGNAVDNFIRLISTWNQELYGEEMSSNHHIDKSRLFQMVDECMESNVETRSTFIQERGYPDDGASISHIHTNTSLVQMIASICHGVIDNLFNIFSFELLHKLGIDRVVLVGAAHSPRYRRRIEQMCQEHGIIVDGSEVISTTPFGAAIFQNL